MPEGWLGGTQLHKNKKIYKKHQKRIWTILKRFRSHMDSEKYCLPAILSLRGFFFGWFLRSPSSTAVLTIWRDFGAVLERVWSGFVVILASRSTKIHKKPKTNYSEASSWPYGPEFRPVPFSWFFSTEKTPKLCFFYKNMIFLKTTLSLGWCWG